VYFLLPISEPKLSEAQVEGKKANYFKTFPWNLNVKRANAASNPFNNPIMLFYDISDIDVYSAAYMELLESVVPSSKGL
jgi:hypothetical protein